jgi:hypothetical protein
MFKKLIIFACILILASKVSGQEQKVYLGERQGKSLASAHLLWINSGPRIPDDEFKKLFLYRDRYTSAGYRITFARYEIFVSLNVDLIGNIEDLEQGVVSTYNVPLEKALNFDRGYIRVLEWKSFDTLIIKCEGPNSDFNAKIKILPFGKFIINKM